MTYLISMPVVAKIWQRAKHAGEGKEKEPGVVCVCVYVRGLEYGLNWLRKQLL